tara:strand:+ start:873 stop:2084 length:1212 start_codon:yes stop_codon:yes gene_type:complete
MKGTLNAHRLFAGTDKHNGYSGNLKISAQQQQALRDARDLIRKTLREGMPLQEHVIKSHGLIDQAFLQDGGSISLRPKFRMQGSAVYHTLNDPAHKPPQEIDYDDGVFLPTSYLVKSNRPALTARGYFKAVENALSTMCKTQGWILDTSKNSCVRVKISDLAHIDVPLYAIPDEEFERLVEAARASAEFAAADSAVDDVSFSEPMFKSLRDDQIMLAVRDKGWLESDPRKIEDWFLEAIRDHGESLRYVCRYLKGWRDFTWKKSSLSSLSLMACAVRIFDDFNGAPPKSRHDLALLLVAEQLPRLLAGSIENPVLDDQLLNEEWSDQERTEFVTGAERLYAGLQNALQETVHKGLAIRHLQNLFGPRIPTDEALIDLESEETTVYTYEPRRTASPIVPRTISG